MGEDTPDPDELVQTSLVSAWMARLAFAGLTTLLTAVMFHGLSIGTFDAVLSAFVILPAVLVDLLRCMLRNVIRTSAPRDAGFGKRICGRFMNAGFAIGAITSLPISYWIVLGPDSFVESVVFMSGVRWQVISYDYVRPLLERFPVFQLFAERMANDRVTVLALKLGFAIAICRTLLACYLAPLVAAAICRGAEAAGAPRLIQLMGTGYLMAVVLPMTVGILVLADATILLGKLIWVLPWLDVMLFAAVFLLAANAETLRIRR
jgi:hypothetical protein